MPPSLKPTRPSLNTSGWFGELIRTAVFVLVVTVLFDLAIPRSLVDGRSMEPTFEDAERLVVSRLHYLFGQPARGNIVVFNSVERPNGDMLIKRIIGLPGETVEIRDSRVYINGAVLDEPYIKELCIPARCQDAVWELGPDEYFVMGDNRNGSSDSRKFGPVPADHLVGEVVFRYWPLHRFGLVIGGGR